MAAWAFQSVLNVGIQIILLVFTGWCFPRFGLLTAEQFMGQINVLILRVAFPTLTIYMLGLKVDLRDAEAWRSLGAYVLWVTLVQLGIVGYSWACKGRNTGDAAVLNLVLTANNTIIVGLPVMLATFPDAGSRLSLLSAFVLFLQVIPFSITAFEMEKWMAEDLERRRAAAAARPDPPSTPHRELSGRWVEQGGDEDGCSRQDGSCRAGVAAAGNGVAAAADLCEGTWAASSEGDGERGGRVEGAGARPFAAIAKGGGGGGGSSNNRSRTRKSVLGRRRFSGGIVIGAADGGWAPATPLDSRAASRAASSCPAYDGENPTSVAAAAAVGMAAGGPGAGGGGGCRGLIEQPTLARGVGLAAAAAAAEAAEAAAQPRGEISLSISPSPLSPSLHLAKPPLPPSVLLFAPGDGGNRDPPMGSQEPSVWLDAANREVPQRQGHRAEDSVGTPTLAAPTAPPWMATVAAQPDFQAQATALGGYCRTELTPRSTSTPGAVTAAVSLDRQATAGPGASGGSSSSKGGGIDGGSSGGGGGGGAGGGGDDVGREPNQDASAAAVASPKEPKSQGPSAGPLLLDGGLSCPSMAEAAEAPPTAAPAAAPAAPGLPFLPARGCAVAVVPESTTSTSRDASGVAGANCGPAPAGSPAAEVAAFSFSILSVPCSRDRSLQPQPSGASQGPNAAATAATVPAATCRSAAPDSPAAAADTGTGTTVAKVVTVKGSAAPSKGLRMDRGTGAAATSGAVAVRRRILESRASGEQLRRRSRAASTATAPATATATTAADDDDNASGRTARTRLTDSGLWTAPTVVIGDRSMHRQSLPVHWPPVLALGRVDGPAAGGGRPNDPGRGTAAAAAAGAAASGVLRLSQCGSPGPSPPLSRRLLNPLAVACPDLPVPQAISLARAPTSGLGPPTEPRVSCSGGSGYDKAVRRDGIAITIAYDHARDVSTRPSARRGATAMQPQAYDIVQMPDILGPGPGPGLSPPLLPDISPVGEVRSDGVDGQRHREVAAALWHWLKLSFLQYRFAWSIAWVVVKNPLLWSLQVALLVNLSGLRTILYPDSRHYRPELGWVAGSLSWASSITVPVSLFSNGVWLYGKKFRRRTLVQAGGLVLLKIVALGPLQLACAAVCRLRAEEAMSLLLLALCPVASTSFVIASQYGHGTDIVTAVTLLGTVLLVPVALAALAIPRELGLYSYSVHAS